jgi:hypothetical protein
MMREEGLRERLIEGGRQAILRYPLENTVNETVDTYGRALS